MAFNYAFPFNVLTNATLQFWINPSSIGGESDVFWTTNVGGDTNRFNILINSAGQMYIDYRDAGGVIHLGLTSSLALAANQWSLVRYVKQGSTYSVYINNLFAGQATDSSPLPTSTGWSINGRAALESSGHQFSGFLDEIQLSDQALVPTPIPAPFLLFGTVFGGSCLLIRARRRKRTTALTIALSQPTCTIG